jgi:hypothetical protein
VLTTDVENGSVTRDRRPLAACLSTALLEVAPLHARTYVQGSEEPTMTAKTWRDRPPQTITIAGLPIPRALVEHLVARVEEPTFTKLADALDHETRVLALEIIDRELILRALEDCPDGLTELRATLLNEHVGRKRDGLG